MRQSAEMMARRQLLDSESARYEWPFGMVPGTVNVKGHGKVQGWVLCGYVNAKNRMGGYTGRQLIMAFGRQPDLFVTEIGDEEGLTIADVICRPLVKKGLLPAGPVAVDTVPIGELGFNFQPTPIGAIVIALRPGSIAAQAGLTVGDIIESVNGVSLKGMAPASMQSAVTAPAAALTYGITNKPSVAVKRR